MQYTNLGRSGLKVSRIALGCMTYWLKPTDWFLGEAESREFIKRALDLGITYVDTAYGYGDGDRRRPRFA